MSSAGSMNARRSRYLKAAVRIETGGKDVEQVAAETIESLGLKTQIDDVWAGTLASRRAK